MTIAFLAMTALAILLLLNRISLLKKIAASELIHQQLVSAYKQMESDHLSMKCEIEEYRPRSVEFFQNLNTEKK
jgi:hypothetical protein